MSPFHHGDPTVRIIGHEGSRARQLKTIGLPGWATLTIRAIVLGPDNVPKITDLAEAVNDVVLTMFSALT
ncbi:MAG: hypothetical protein HOV97_43675, partial [Nonomuraea sp.]|nr:hypothetical protein [Nonomuraea sp.]